MSFWANEYEVYQDHMKSLEGFGEHTKHLDLAIRLQAIADRYEGSIQYQSSAIQTTVLL